MWSAPGRSCWLIRAMIVSAPARQQWRSRGRGLRRWRGVLGLAVTFPDRSVLTVVLWLSLCVPNIAGSHYLDELLGTHRPEGSASEPFGTGDRPDRPAERGSQEGSPPRPGDDAGSA